jgi:hypothetical protein
MDEVAERVLDLANKNNRTGPIKQTFQKPNSNIASQSQSKDKESQTPKPQPSVSNKKESYNSQPLKNNNTPSKPFNKNEPFNPTKNVFQIVDTPKQTTQQLPDSENVSTIFDKFLKTIEKTTSRLEETVKKVPRPWELTPGTSIGYQMLTGNDKDIDERIRKGFVQFIGRYLTNIKEPRDYSTDLRDIIPFPQQIKSILTDKPKWFENKPTTSFEKEVLPARDTLYRELFDLPSRKETTGIKKVGEKEYQLSNIPQPQPEELISPNMMKAYLEGKLKQNQIDELKKQNPKPHTVIHPLMGQTYLTPTTDGKFSYSDV